jgi:GNAT superfamily N-acetyltransferase
MHYETTDEIKEQDQRAIYEGLLQYNLERLEDKSPKDLGVYARDEAGNIIAGLIGNTHGNWLTVKFLWVSESLRGKNIGSGILKQAEETAKQRGCKFAFLDTFSFQAPLFYQKHGYREVFALEDYPLTGKRYYFTKSL